MECEAKVKLKQKDLIAWRFWQGKWVASCYDLGMDTQDIFDKTGISKITLRECFRFYEHPQFGKDSKKLQAWLDDNETLYWYHVQALIKSNRDPDVVTREEWIKRGIRYIEGAGRRIEEMTEYLVEETGDDLQDQVDSAIFAFMESARQFVDLSGGQEPIPRDKAHLKWVDEQECSATGIKHDDVTHHHVGTEGTAEKTSDYLSIPVRFHVHNEIHQYGHRWVEKRYNFSILKALVNILHRKITGVNAKLPAEIE